MKEKIKNEELKKIENLFQKTEDFKTHYVTGAIGGFKNKYDFRLSFYNIDSNGFILKMKNISEKTDIENALEDDKDLRMKHNVVCEVIMSEPAVRELYDFIGRQLEAMEKAKKSIHSENSNEN
jgi:hypothetical protein